MTDVFATVDEATEVSDHDEDSESGEDPYVETAADKSRSILDYLYTYKWMIGFLTILCGLLSCLNLALPYILKVIIDDILPEKKMTMLAYALLAVLVILVSKNLVYYITKTRITHLGEKVALEIREELFHHLHQLSIGFFRNNNPGSLSSRLMQDVNTVKGFVQDQMMKFLMNVLMAVVSFGIMFWLHWRLAIIALVVLPLHWLVHRMYQRSIKKYARKVSNTIGSITGDVVEQFSGAQEVKSSVAESEEEEQFKKTMRLGVSAKMEETRHYLRQKILADGLVGIGQLLVIGFAAYSIINGSMKVGTFIAFYGYTGMLYPKTLKLISQAGKFSSTAASLDRIFEILNTQPNIRERTTARSRKIREGKIEFRNVSFSYDHEQVLDGLSFSAQPGEHVLISGVSGSGKTTLLNLIPRFYEPDSGRILIDDVDVKDYTLESLRKQIGIVFQDCFLFGSSVQENIHYARPEATREEILMACRKANAHEFIMDLPHGYRTEIGEEGVHLSGGEEQRLVIARTILKDPAILVLDEALTALDYKSRKTVAENLMELMEDRTMFTVTYDPSTFRNIDREISLEKEVEPKASMSAR